MTSFLRNCSPLAGSCPGRPSLFETASRSHGRRHLLCTTQKSTRVDRQAIILPLCPVRSSSTTKSAARHMPNGVRRIDQIRKFQLLTRKRVPQVITTRLPPKKGKEKHPMSYRNPWRTFSDESNGSLGRQQLIGFQQSYSGNMYWRISLPAQGVN
jgi:hypothetical protein